MSFKGSFQMVKTCSCCGDCRNQRMFWLSCKQPVICFGMEGCGIISAGLRADLLWQKCATRPENCPTRFWPAAIWASAASFRASSSASPAAPELPETSPMPSSSVAATPEPQGLASVSVDSALISTHRFCASCSLLFMTNVTRFLASMAATRLCHYLTRTRRKKSTLTQVAKSRQCLTKL